MEYYTIELKTSGSAHFESKPKEYYKNDIVRLSDGRKNIISVNVNYIVE